MDYFFCDFKVKVEMELFCRQSEYDIFRVDNERIADCTIKSAIVSKLQLPEQKPVFQSVQGLRVVLDGPVEYRYYIDYFTSEIRELLIDDGKCKELQFLNERKLFPMTELDVINCLGFEKTMSEHGLFILHASLIRTRRGAVLFTAPSGTGKSTQADLWKKYRGAEIINGDRSGVWKNGNTWMAGGVPWCGTSGIMKNKTMPLLAIVILRQGLENEVRDLQLPVKRLGVCWNKRLSIHGIRR